LDHIPDLNTTGILKPKSTMPVGFTMRFLLTWAIFCHLFTRDFDFPQSTACQKFPNEEKYTDDDDHNNISILRIYKIMTFLQELLRSELVAC